MSEKLEFGTKLMYKGQYEYALKIFTDIIETDPEWSEAWNKRATLLFLMKDYQKSLDDISKVLDLEPIKNGLSEIYEIEINAFDTNEWNPNVTPSNVVEVISVIKAYPGPIGGLYDKRWTEAQLMRKKLYEYWITEMVDKGLGR